jgi:hypothetical protein
VTSKPSLATAGHSPKSFMPARWRRALSRPPA